LRLIHAQAESLAGELAPMLADSWRNSTKARYMLTLKRAQKTGAARLLTCRRWAPEMAAYNSEVELAQELSDPKNEQRGG